MVYRLVPDKACGNISKWAWVQTVKLAISEAVCGKKKSNKKEMSLFVHMYVAAGLLVLCQSYGDPVFGPFPWNLKLASSIPKP